MVRVTRIEKHVAITLASLLACSSIAIAQTTPIPPPPVNTTPLPSPDAPPLLTQQRESVQRLVRQEIEENRDIRDRIQAEVSQSFSWTITLINLLLIVLIAIPIAIGITLFWLRRSAVHQLTQTIKRQIQQETGSAVEDHLSQQLATELNQKVESFKQELDQLKSRFVAQLQNLFAAEGDALYVTGHYEDALLAYEKAIAMQPGLVSAWIGKAKALEQMERYDDAIAANEQVIQLAPNQPDGWFGKGNVLADLRQYDAALAAYETAIEQDPRFCQAWNQRGYVLTKLGYKDNALTSFAKALELKGL
jgi:tetratricopeptide (TPR) repeat protein